MNGVSHFGNGRRLGRRSSFVALVCANVLMMATASAPSPIYPLYRERWGFSVTMLTVIFAVYVAGLLGALLTAGSLSDHLGRRPVLVAALLVAAASTAIFWAADGVTDRTALRFVTGGRAASSVVTNRGAARSSSQMPRSSAAEGACHEEKRCGGRDRRFRHRPGTSPLAQAIRLFPIDIIRPGSP
jgi:MFS family permease